MADDRNSLAVHLGGRLRFQGMCLGIFQEKLTRRTSLHRTEVSMLERGGREPRLGTIVKLASAGGVAGDGDRVEGKPRGKAKGLPAKAKGAGKTKGASRGKSGKDKGGGRGAAKGKGGKA